MKQNLFKLLMTPIKTIFAFLLLLVSGNNYAQLGFCTGSKGDPVFTENFGNGSGATALPAGITTYPFSPTPNDGFYSVINHTNFFQPSWHVIPDHTPDATNGPSGKMMIVNANTAAAGDFFKKTVTGLCVNTTFEFSAWLINLYNSASNICVGAAQIPINVRFEIWNATETVLLASGNTGNIFGTPAPLWQQFALVFTTVSETSVVLKMKNNGVGGCGNDLAIDDISFAACGDPTTVGTFPTPSPGNIYSSCNPPSLHLKADSGSTSYFYQWQSSPDGIVWTDIVGETNPDYYTLAGLNTLTYFRVKAAQDAANLSNVFCSINSNTFTISPLAGPNTATGTNQVICSNQTIPALSVTVPAGTGVNWYNASTGGTLLLANSTSYTPTTAGTYYAETYNTTTNCISSTRLPVQLTINALPTVTISATNPVVVGNTYSTCVSPALVQLTATPSGASTYVYQWQTSPDGTNWTDIPGGTNQIYNASASALTYFRVKVAQDAANLITSCSALSNVFTISILPAPSPALSDGDKVICSNQAIPSLSVTPSTGASVSWYNAPTGGALLLANSASYTPTAAGIYYAETYITSCIASPRTPVELTINPLPTVSINGNPLVVGNTYATCNNPASLTLNAVASGAASYAYQWQSSADGANWTNIAGATNATYTPSVTSLTYFRVKVAQDAASLAANFCSNLSNVFTISFLPTPTPALSNGDQVICSNQPIPALSVTLLTGTSVNWYSSPTGGTLLQANNASYTPTAAGTYYAETYDVASNCIGSPRTQVKLTVNSLPTVSVNGNPLVAVNTYTTCNNPASLTLNAVASGASTYAYQWQSSSDGINWTNIAGANNATYTPSVSSLTYFRARAAQDATNLGTTCSTLSNVFTISILPAPTPALSNGDKVICSNQPIPVLSVTALAGTSVNWYNAPTGGTLLQANNASYLPATAGTFYAETYNVATTCVGNSRTAVKLTIIPLPTVSINTNPPVVGNNYSTCTNPASVTLQAVASGASAYFYQWQTSTDGINWTNVPGATSAIYNATITSALTYFRVKVAQDTTSLTTNFCASTSNVFTVTILPPPNPAISNGDQVICSNQPIPALSVTSTAGTSVNWYSAATGGTLLQANNTSYTPTSGGTYYAETYNVASNCIGSPRTPVKLTILPLPIPAITDGVICTTSFSPPSSQFYTLDTHLNPADHSFQWFFGVNPIPGASGSTYNATQIGTYTVIATNSAGCVSTPVDAVVSQRPQGESLVVQQSAAFSDDPTVTVSVVGGSGPFFYQLDGFAFQSSNVFQNLTAGTHTITVVDEFCTNLTAIVTIIDYPKYFTPNEDGYNDTWNIKGFDAAVIRIFDRYGKLLKQISPNGLGWDGTFNGQLLPSTDYWFTIEYVENGVTKTFKAHFAMKR